LDEGLTLSLEDNEAGFEYGYAGASGRKLIVNEVDLILQEAVGLFRIAGS